MKIHITAGVGDLTPDISRVAWPLLQGAEEESSSPSQEVSTLTSSFFGSGKDGSGHHALWTKPV